MDQRLIDKDRQSNRRYADPMGSVWVSRNCGKLDGDRDTSTKKKCRRKRGRERELKRKQEACIESQRERDWKSNSEGWLQVNLILDGSSSPLKYLVNRFRSSIHPRSVQTIRFSFPSPQKPASLSYESAIPPIHPRPILQLVNRYSLTLSLSFFLSYVSESHSRQNEELLNAVRLIFKSIPIFSCDHWNKPHRYRDNYYQ